MPSPPEAAYTARERAVRTSANAFGFRFMDIVSHDNID